MKGETSSAMFDDGIDFVEKSCASFPGLYIHIPFCKRKCDYCDFYSTTSTQRIPDFIKALTVEMDIYRGQFTLFDTIYFGGGTPSLLNPQQVAWILRQIRAGFEILADTEITFEANPADLTPGYVRSILETGINRINIGVQSFDEDVLGFLGRRHSTDQAEYAIKCARRNGFSNIGLDLIYGIPGQEIDSWLATLERALSHEPEHISCYQLKIEKGTPLWSRLKRGEFRLIGEEKEYQFFVRTVERLRKAGYIQYEVSNFAKEERYVSRHNLKYWNHTPYLGLGPGAHSMLGNRRWWNRRSLSSYIRMLSAGKAPVEGSESLTEEQLCLEALYLGLRTLKGIDIENFRRRYGCNLLDEKKEILSMLEREGLISVGDGFLRPTLSGIAVADSLSLI